MELVDTGKVSIEGKAALKQLGGVTTLYSTKGKKLVTLELKNTKPTQENLLELMLGPTGRLRAPSARIGDAFVVGFSEELYRQLLT